MKLTGEAKTQHSLSAGVYIFKGEVNSRDYWVHENGKRAMWYSPSRRWVIGRINDVGTTLAYMRTNETTNALCPFSNVYDYWGNDQWNNGIENIKVLCAGKCLIYVTFPPSYCS